MRAISSHLLSRDTLLIIDIEIAKMRTSVCDAALIIIYFLSGKNSTSSLENFHDYSSLSEEYSVKISGSTVGVK